jgi:hypothetical protein
MLFAALLSLVSLFDDENPPLKNIKQDSIKAKVWEYGAEFKLNFSLANSSPNWSSGNSNNITVTGLVNAGANLKWKRLSWDNKFKLNLGLVSNRQEQQRFNWKRLS